MKDRMICALFLIVLFLWLEDVFGVSLEQLAGRECERQARVVCARLDCIDGPSRHVRSTSTASDHSRSAHNTRKRFFIDSACPRETVQGRRQQHDGDRDGDGR
jgi:hypothetical protein